MVGSNESRCVESGYLKILVVEGNDEIIRD